MMISLQMPENLSLKLNTKLFQSLSSKKVLEIVLWQKPCWYSQITVFRGYPKVTNIKKCDWTRKKNWQNLNRITGFTLATGFYARS